MKRKYAYIYLGVLLTVSLFLTACSKGADKQSIAVSIEPQRYLLEQIVGDRWEVVTLLDRGADPENFDPSMTAMKKAMSAQAYMKMGHIAFEDAVVGRMSSTDRMKLFDTSKGIHLITGSHDCGHHHHEDEADHGHSHEADPHVWSSVKNAKVIAANMYQAVLELDPTNADYYTKNYNELTQKLESLDNELTDMLEPHRGEAFLVWHPSLSYFARDYGLEQLALGMGGKESSAREMKENIDLAREEGATVMFVQPEFDYKKSEELALQTGTRTVTINPLNYNWDQEMLLTARAIANANENPLDGE